MEKQIEPTGLKQLLVDSAKEVFEKMVTMPVDTHEEDTSNIFRKGELQYSAVIGFSGGWKGFVTIKSDRILAARITSKMLFMDEASLNEEDIRDALGEIANMIGGKFKSLFAEAYNDGKEAFKMSIPSITAGHDFQTFATGENSQVMVILDAEDDMMLLDLALRKTIEKSVRI